MVRVKITYKDGRIKQVSRKNGHDVHVLLYRERDKIKEWEYIGERA